MNENSRESKMDTLDAMIKKLEIQLREKMAKQLRVERDYTSLNLKFNPFPVTGIPPEWCHLLPPLDKTHLQQIFRFVQETYSARGAAVSDYSGLVIIGDYGMGKTHTLRFIKKLIEQLRETHKELPTPVTAFIERPEKNILIVIQRIIEQIGHDLFRKYLWRIILVKIREKYQDQAMKRYFLRDGALTRYMSTEKVEKTTKSLEEQLFDDLSVSNYLRFIRLFEQHGGNIDQLRQDAEEILREEGITKDPYLLDLFLDLILKDKEGKKSWEVLIGHLSSKRRTNKEVEFLNSLIGILQKNNHSNLYVFIDEFEHIVTLSRKQRLSYLRTLNTLINVQRKWAVAIALTREALELIKSDYPPLHDRLTRFLIELRPLDHEQARQLTMNFLVQARIQPRDDLHPFTEEDIKFALEESQGNYRLFIHLLHDLIEEKLQES